MAFRACEELRPGLLGFEGAMTPESPLPYLAFCRQLLPDARQVEAPSIRSWAGLLVDAVAGVLPDHQPWSLHLFPFIERGATTRMGARAWHTRLRAKRSPEESKLAAPASRVTESRCQLIRQATVELLQKRRRHLVRYLRPEGARFVEDEALVQVMLVSTEQGYISLAHAPLPFVQRHVLSSFPGGEVPLASDKDAPSRAFAKLVEAEARLGRRIGARETCVDLGASPGSWTYVAVRRGAKVTAVDRSELRADLMQHRQVRFARGDAFRYEPTSPVDWLLCDVIASAERSAELLLRWLRERWCRSFVVTLKVDDAGSSDALARLKHELPALTAELGLLRLSANKKEVCAFGVAR